MTKLPLSSKAAQKSIRAVRADQAFNASTAESQADITRTLQDEIRFSDSGELRRLMLDELRTHSRNARWEGNPGPTWEQVLGTATAPIPEYLKEGIENIQEIAASMEAGLGQLTPIDASRVGGVYEILMGECRYWALRLWEHRSQKRVLAKVIVHPEPPKDQSLHQYTENAHRRGLGLRPTLWNLEDIVAETKRLGLKPITDAVSLQTRVGLSETTAYRWWAVISGPEDVRIAIREGTITSITHAYAAAQEADPELRRALISKSELVDSSPSVQPRPPAEPPSPAPAQKRGRGRPQSGVSLGRTTSLPFLRHVLIAINPDLEKSNTDWNDLPAVTKMWIDLKNQLEKRFATGQDANNGE